jgi:NAD(P)-dependent dehydrogenase (short-subunit alcohol dehydrogenase family)
MAKAALNQQTATLAQELKLAGFNITVVSINPGHVATRLTNFNSKVDINIAIPSLFKVIEDITMENTGQFLNWDGVKMNL